MRRLRRTLSLDRRDDALPRVDLSFARELIDFDPKNESTGKESGFGHSQLEGAVQAFNMLATNRVAYLADEVGLGKTYVALGVVGLLRHLRPDARVMFLAPRENIQIKWMKEHLNFVHNNWRVPDNRVKSIQGTPARRSVFVPRLESWVHELVLGDRRDLFLRMTSFSPSFKKVEDRRKLRRWLRTELPWIPQEALAAKTPEAFRDQVGRVLNAAVPEIDLLVVDEAHNLKHGFTDRGSTRNRLLGLALGHPAGDASEATWYGPRVRNALLLSATPFEADLTALQRQLDLLGLNHLELTGGEGRLGARVAQLADPELEDTAGREIARHFLTRRVGFLNAGGERLTKNLYRREWRGGGFEAPSEPMRLTDPRQRLVVGLVQRKVAEVLGREDFGSQFQIGMLSSFESFLESVARKKKRQQAEIAGAEASEASEFDDADQTDDADERRGLDTRALDGLVQSYRDRFGAGLPHPKLDATSDSLARSFETGEKALVFVRRVATAAELGSKLARVFDRWILARLLAALPEMEAEIGAQFERYQRERGDPDASSEAFADSHEGQDEPEPVFLLEDDEGGTEDFFAWFFRGEGPSGVLSGAAFQKNRLANASSAYSTLFEDDYVARLLGRPKDTIAALGTALGLDRVELERALRRLAWGHYSSTWKRRATGYPRFYLFESYQAAALWLLHRLDTDLAQRAADVLHQRFQEFHGLEADPPETLPASDGFIGIETFFTELVRRPRLRSELWPADDEGDFLATFRRSEQRRELLSAMSRLGISYVDLWSLAVRPLRTLALGRAGERGGRPDRELAVAFAELLEAQREEPGLHAYRELREAAKSFDTLLAVNFPEVRDAPLVQLPRIFTSTLGSQMPVGTMSGKVNHRLVRQFRMPGFPVVLVTTDVLQEGEDLHTFCRQVVHYGITWTPSAMEQRTGRVDRIGGLAQREIDGAPALPAEEAKIQVYYPHLPGTIEVLQVRRVLARLDRFLTLVHEGLGNDRSDSRIDTGRELLRALPLSEPPKQPLRTAFPVRDAWLEGEVGPEGVEAIDVASLAELFETHWSSLVADLGVRRERKRGALAATGELRLLRGELVDETAVSASDPVRRQVFDLELHSRAAGDSTLVRCSSVVGTLDLDDDRVLDRLYELQRSLGHARVCAKLDERHRRYQVRIERSLLFEAETLQLEELESLVVETTSQADRIEEELLGVDASRSDRDA